MNLHDLWRPIATAPRDGSWFFTKVEGQLDYPYDVAKFDIEFDDFVKAGCGFDHVTHWRPAEMPGSSDAIPPGMKPWHGGDGPPADWDGGPVLRRHGGLSMPDGEFAWASNGGGLGNVIAYTAKAPAKPDYEPAWREMHDALSWMQGNRELHGYWGLNLAVIANDLIDRAYPGLRDGKTLPPDQSRIAINRFTLDVHAAQVAAGWWSDLETGEPIKRNVGELLCLVHSEISEAMEGHRKSLMDDKLPHRPMIEVELADAIIRIADLAGGLGLDLGGAVTEKMAYNAKREDHKLEIRRAAGGKAY